MVFDFSDLIFSMNNLQNIDSHKTYGKSQLELIIFHASDSATRHNSLRDTDVHFSHIKLHLVSFKFWVKAWSQSVEECSRNETLGNQP